MTDIFIGLVAGFAAGVLFVIGIALLLGGD